MTTIPLLSTEWILSFDIKVLGVFKVWSNILHLTIGGNDGNFGENVPGVYMKVKTTQIKFQCDTDVVNTYITSTNTLEIGKKYHVEIHQRYINHGTFSNHL